MVTTTDPAPASPSGPYRWRRRVMAGAGLAALALGGLWLAREPLGRAAIDRALAENHVPARYHLSAVGPGGITLDHLVIGDPQHPDFTAERIDIALGYGFGGPAIGRITVDHVRLAGRYADGALHFGALDPLLTAKGPATGPVLPHWGLALNDARARIDTPAGAVGLSADGAGMLDDGFAGALGVVMPQARLGGCTVARTTFYGRIATTRGRPSLAGPLRLGAADCASLRSAAGRIDLTLGADPALAAFSIDARGGVGQIEAGPGVSLAGLQAAAGLRWDLAKARLAGRITLDGARAQTPAVHLAHARFDGVLEANPAAGVFDMRGDLDAGGLERGAQVAAAFTSAQAQASGTPLAPLLARIDAALRREEPGNRLAGAIGLHTDAAGWRLAAPRLAWSGGHSGLPLARIERVVLAGGDGRIPRLAGDFATFGADLPHLSGQMTTGQVGAAAFALTMAPYAAGEAQLAVPAMAISQAGDGSLGFSGTVALSGPFTGGRIDGLRLPVEGGLAGDGHLALWRRCVAGEFAHLAAGTLDLAPARITLCPVGGAIVRQGAGGIAVAASAKGLALGGHAGAQPITITTGAVRIAWPGTSSADAIDAVMGKGDSVSRYHLAHATIDPPAATGGVPGGSFAGGSVDLAGLPATAGSATGTWRFDQGKLKVTQGTMLLTDRAVPARFFPVAARDAALVLDSAGLTGSARVVASRVPADLAKVTLQHDLASGRGHADVAMDALTFRERDPKRPDLPALQPDQLTDAVLGQIAKANGTLRGHARFDWDTTRTDGGVTGSGTIATNDFDFAAAFGPVEGLAGTITFTDLVHLVTAPHQVLKVASINPGIEVVGGTIDLELPGNQVVRLNGASWPFEGGSLSLEPVDLNMAVAEPRRFNLVIKGLEAGRFLQHINMSNLSASGLFDGRLPLVFDANGGRIVGGQLTSRPPGGSVSYVGALSYKDLSPMANFAFKMLRSIDYRQMVIGMQGDLAGEVVTKVSFSGISQGKLAERNLITRQLAALPIQFNVNIRAQFYSLISSLRSLYDPTSVKSPRDVGLVDAHGRPVHQHGGEQPIQPQASGTMP